MALTHIEASDTNALCGARTRGFARELRYVTCGKCLATIRSCWSQDRARAVVSAVDYLAKNGDAEMAKEILAHVPDGEDLTVLVRVRTHTAEWMDRCARVEGVAGVRRDLRLPAAALSKWRPTT